MEISVQQGTAAAPAGAATAANQTTEIARLDTLVTQTNRSPINANATGVTNAAVGIGAVITLAAPANAVGFLLQADIANTNTVRWRQGADPTTSDGSGLEGGQDTGYIPCGVDVRVIAAVGTQKVHLNWVIR